MTRRLAVALVSVFSVIAVVGAAVVVAVVAGRPSAVPSPADPDVRFVAGTAIAVPASPADVEWGAGSVWVSSGDDGSLTRVDPATGATSRIVVGGQPGQIVATEQAVWVRNLGDRITRVDTASGAVSPPIPGGGGQINGMAVAGGSVWLSHRDAGTVTRLDARTLAVVGTIPVDREPATMETDGTSVYVLTIGDGGLTRIDATTGEVRGRIDVGAALGGIEVDDGVVYVAADGGVVAVPTDTFTARPLFTPGEWSYFEVAAGVMWVVHDAERMIRRYTLGTLEPIGEPVPGFGDEITKVRYAAGRLWLGRPSDDVLVPLSPEGVAIGQT